MHIEKAKELQISAYFIDILLQYFMISSTFINVARLMFHFQMEAVLPRELIKTVQPQSYSPIMRQKIRVIKKELPAF